MIDGIQKRLERVVDPDELRRRLEALLPDDQDGTEPAGAVKHQIRATSAKIRLIAALAGDDDVPSLRSAVVVLELERTRLTEELRVARARCSAAEGRDAPSSSSSPVWAMYATS